MFYNYKKIKKGAKMQYKILENNRIASKGYAMLSKDAKFTPLNLAAMLLAIMIF